VASRGDSDNATPYLHADLASRCHLLDLLLDCFTTLLDDIVREASAVQLPAVPPPLGSPVVAAASAAVNAHSPLAASYSSTSTALAATIPTAPASLPADLTGGTPFFRRSTGSPHFGSTAGSRTVATAPLPSPLAVMHLASPTPNTAEAAAISAFAGSSSSAVGTSSIACGGGVALRNASSGGSGSSDGQFTESPAPSARSARISRSLGGPTHQLAPMRRSGTAAPTASFAQPPYSLSAQSSVATLSVGSTLTVAGDHTAESAEVAAEEPPIPTIPPLPSPLPESVDGGEGDSAMHEASRASPHSPSDANNDGGARNREAGRDVHGDNADDSWDTDTSHKGDAVEHATFSQRPEGGPSAEAGPSTARMRSAGDLETR